MTSQSHAHYYDVTTFSKSEGVSLLRMRTIIAIVTVQGEKREGLGYFGLLQKHKQLSTRNKSAQENG